MYEICTCVLGIGIREHGLSFRVFLILKLYLFPILLLLTYGKFPHLSSVQFSHAVMSDSLRPHGLQHSKLPCPPVSPEICSNSCPLSQWCHPTNSSSLAPFSSCPQSFPASRSFPMSWLFTSGGQSIGASDSASVLPMNVHGWFPLGLTGLIFLQSKGLSRIFSSTTVWKHQFVGTRPWS